MKGAGIAQKSILEKVLVMEGLSYICQAELIVLNPIRFLACLLGMIKAQGRIIEKWILSFQDGQILDGMANSRLVLFIFPKTGTDILLTSRKRII